MISLAITTYNRTSLLYESYSKIINHPLIEEVVICDDRSNDNVWDDLQKNCNHKKIRLFRNDKNLNMSLNKAEAISKCKNDWVIILDSDNVLEVEYVDVLPIKSVNTQCGTVGWLDIHDEVICCPQFASPDYDFSDLPTIIDKSNAKHLLSIKEFRIFLNTCNYVVNREKYLEVYRYNPDIKESDTVWLNYLWLKAGYSFYIVPGMKYYHRRHAGSGWLNGDHEYNLRKADELQNLIKEL